MRDRIRGELGKGLRPDPQHELTLRQKTNPTERIQTVGTVHGRRVGRSRRRLLWVAGIEAPTASAWHRPEGVVGGLSLVVFFLPGPRVHF